MQWNSSANAGFSSAPPGKLWLPITDNTNYETVNVEVGNHGQSVHEFRRWFDNKSVILK